MRLLLSLPPSLTHITHALTRTLHHPLARWLTNYVRFVLVHPLPHSHHHPRRRPRGRQVTDYFVSMYVQGDFLTTHQDFNLGTYAFVLQLSKDWEPSFGGALAFSCRRSKPLDRCRSLVPLFNTMTIFQTRPDLVDHWVEEVVVPTERTRRYAVTGWIATGDDTFDRNNQGLRDQKGTY